jgi:protein gp37
MTTATDTRWVSWNPVSGCTPVSAGCAHCYAQRFAERWRGIAGHPYEHGFDLQLRPQRLDLPLRWHAPRRVFVDSMSDLFHEGIPDEYVADVFAVMAMAQRHVFHVFTKRDARMAALAPRLPWPPNLWMGVTVERGDYARRADSLRAVPAAVRFVCAEPLLGPLDALDLEGIDWVVAGGESGPGRRPPHPDWLRGLRDRCLAAHVPFTFKGWGGRVQGQLGRELDGREWLARPPGPAIALPDSAARPPQLDLF